MRKEIEEVKDILDNVPDVCYQGDLASMSGEEMTFLSSARMAPNTIWFHRICMGDSIDKLVFSDGSVFRRTNEKEVMS